MVMGCEAPGLEAVKSAQETSAAPPPGSGVEIDDNGRHEVRELLSTHRVKGSFASVLPAWTKVTALKWELCTCAVHNPCARK